MSSADYDMFGRGGCWALAQAIHDLTGWPMRALDRTDGPGGHAFIEMPDGRFLDVHGAQNPDEYMWTRRERAIPLDSTEDWTLPTWFNFRRWDRHACLARARKIAPQLVAAATGEAATQ